MALIRRAGEPRTRPLSGSGHSKSLESILASQAEGCNRLSVRMLTIRPGGRTARGDSPGERVFHVTAGTPSCMDGDGFVHGLQPGDTVIVRPHERFHLQNEDRDGEVRVLLASEPR